MSGFHIVRDKNHGTPAADRPCSYIQGEQVTSKLSKGHVKALGFVFEAVESFLDADRVRQQDIALFLGGKHHLFGPCKVSPPW